VLILLLQDYYKYLRINWKHLGNGLSVSGRKEHEKTSSNDTSRTRSNKPLVYGIGTALSAPLLAAVTAVSLLSMLLLGDGLAPSVALALASAGSFLYLTSVARLSQPRAGPADLFSVPWHTTLGWFLLEALFFYASGKFFTCNFITNKPQSIKCMLMFCRPSTNISINSVARGLCWHLRFLLWHCPASCPHWLEHHVDKAALWLGLASTFLLSVCDLACISLGKDIAGET